MIAGAGPGSIAELFHHRWSVPVLGCLHESKSAARFVVLVHELGVSRDSLRSALAALIDLGLVARNPGYGHPLRPEYVLTPSGKRVAPECLRYATLVTELALDEAGYRKWTAALLLAVLLGNHRFNAIQASLRGITPRALTSALRLMDEVGLMFRRIEDGYPPRAEYFLSKKGTSAASLVARIAAGLAATNPASTRARSAPAG